MVAAPQIQGQILEYRPVTGKTAFDTWLPLAAKPGETIWLKQGSERFYKGTVTPSGELELWATRGSGEERVKTHRIQNAFEVIAELCQELEGGAFFIPGKPSDLPLKSHCLESDLISAELDEGAPEQQWQRIENFALIAGLKPLFINTSGGKSFHPHWGSKIKIPVEQRTFLGKVLAIALLSDPAVINPAQAMRAPGFLRKEKGNEQALAYHSDSQYTLEELENGLKRFFESQGWLWYSQEEFSLERWKKVRKILTSKRLTFDEKSARIAFALAENEKLASVAKHGFKTKFTGDYISSGASLPLEKFLSRQHQEMVAGGEGEGNRDNGGFRLAKDLIGTTYACNRLGISVEGDPRQLFESYATKCSPALSSQDIERIWRSASNGNSTACVPDEGLLKRASYLDPKGFVAAQQRTEASENKAATDGKLQWLEPYKERVKRTHEVMRSVAEFNPIQQTTGFIDIFIEQLFDNGILDLKHLKPGVYGLQVAMGGGKSHLLREVIKAYPSGNVFTFINAIAQQTCHHPEVADKLLYIWDIKKLEKNSEQRNGWNKAHLGWLGGCIESIEDFSEKAVMVLEEVEQIYKALLLGSTCRRDRKKRLETFKRLYRAAKHIFLADADISGKFLRWLHAIDPSKKINIIQNTTKRFEWQCYFYDGSLETQKDKKVLHKPNKKAPFEEDLRNEVARKKKLLIASDSQRWCEIQEKKIKTVNQQAKILRVDSTTKVSDCKKTRAQVDAFLSNPVAWIEKNQPDHVIYSPTCLASLDIALPDYFDAVWGYFSHLNYLGCKQMLGRLRSNAPRYILAKTFVGSEDNTGSNSPLPQVVAKHMFERNFATIKELILEEFPGVRDDFQVMKKVQELLDPESSTYKNEDVQALVELISQENYSRGNLRQLLAEELDRCGHIVHMLEPQKHDGSSPTSLERKEVIAEWAKAISQAPVIDYEESEKIQRDQNSTMSQRYSVIKSKLQARLPELDLTPQFVEECYLNDRNWVSRQEIRFLLEHPEMAQELDRDTWKFGLQADDAFWDLRSYTLKVKVLTILGIPAIAQESIRRGKNWNAHSPKVIEFRKLAFKHRDLLRLALNISVTMSSDPCALLRRCLRAGGYVTKCSQRKITPDDISEGSKLKVGERARFYRVDAKVLSEVGFYGDAYRAIEKRFNRKLSKPENGSQVAPFNTLKSSTCDQLSATQPLGFKAEEALILPPPPPEEFKFQINDWVVINLPPSPHHGQLAYVKKVDGCFLTLGFYKQGRAQEVGMLIYEVKRYVAA